jgi:hypothetical protein
VSSDLAKDTGAMAYVRSVLDQQLKEILKDHLTGLASTVGTSLLKSLLSGNGDDK